MLAQISGAALALVCREANIAAARAGRRLGLPKHQRDDTCQELLGDFFARSASFDHERGPLGAFAGKIMANKVAGLAARVRRDRRLFAPVSLDDPVSDADGRTIGDTVAESDGYLAMMGLSTDAIAAAEIHFDVLRVLTALDRRDRRLCIALIDSSPTNLEGPGWGSRSTIYRRLQKIRKQLRCYGLADNVRRFSGFRVVPCMQIASKFDEWLSEAAPGDTLEYYEGYLSIDASPNNGRLPEARRLELMRVAHRAWLAAQRGQVHLVQRRIADNVYSYLAVARQQVKQNSVGMACRNRMPRASAHPTPGHI